MLFTPPVPPSVDSAKSVEFRGRPIELGDGAEQRVSYGFNSRRERLELVWSPISRADLDVIVGFFDAREDLESFRWTLPGDSVERTWVVEGYSYRERGGPVYSMRATFREVFDL